MLFNVSASSIFHIHAVSFRRPLRDLLHLVKYGVQLLGAANERGALRQLLQPRRANVRARRPDAAKDFVDGGLDGAFVRHLDINGVSTSEKMKVKY